MVGGLKGNKELDLDNIGNIYLNKLLKYFTIYLFQGTKTPNIKRLKKVEQVGR